MNTNSSTTIIDYYFKRMCSVSGEHCVRLFAFVAWLEWKRSTEFIFNFVIFTLLSLSVSLLLAEVSCSLPLKAASWSGRLFSHKFASIHRECQLPLKCDAQVHFMSFLTPYFVTLHSYELHRKQLYSIQTHKWCVKEEPKSSCPPKKQTKKTTLLRRLVAAICKCMTTGYQRHYSH